MQRFLFFLDSYAPPTPAAPQRQTPKIVLCKRERVCAAEALGTRPLLTPPLTARSAHVPLESGQGCSLGLCRALKPFRAHVTVHVKPPYEVPKARPKDPRQNGQALLRPEHVGGTEDTLKPAKRQKQLSRVTSQELHVTQSAFESGSQSFFSVFRNKCVTTTAIEP